MIPITPQPETIDFDSLVRKPGFIFLSKYPQPTSEQFKKHAYWRKILKEFHLLYNGICAYSCHWIPFDTGAKTIEHFKPKTTFPTLAYEWSNYRLVCNTINGRKGIKEILDPFNIRDNLFTIDFPSLLVMPSCDIDTKTSTKVQQTIIILGLNDEDTCLKSRYRYIMDYCAGDISFNHLCSNAPFIAHELKRQKLEHNIHTIMNC